jgi:hypothetical protein
LAWLEIDLIAYLEIGDVARLIVEPPSERAIRANFFDDYPHSFG